MDESIRILHAEDEPGFGELSATFLERADDRFVVETVTDATEALARLDDDVDCVLSDYEMPGMDGIEFLEAVRERYAALPFVLFTGRGSEEVASDAIAAGVTDYLQKEAGTDQYAVLANRIGNAVERYRAEEGLREMRQAMESILENVPIVLYTIDEGGRFTRSQGRALERVGFEPGEVVGESIYEVFAERPDVVDHYERALEGESVTEVVEFDGVVFQSWYQPLRSPDGTISGVVGHSVDVSERLRRERELERRNDLFAKAQEIADVGAWEYDDRSGELRWTVESHRIHGLPRSFEPTLEAGIEFYHPEDRSTIREAFEGALGGEPYDLELRLITDDGELRWVRTRGDPQTEDGEVVRVRGTIQDVTEAKDRERELERQNERLEAFARAVSHDLQNPLTVARGRLEMAIEDGGTEHLETVAEAHDRMGRLIDDLLALAREGASATDVEVVDPAGIATDCWAGTETTDATLRVECDRSIRADRGRLRQLLENLFVNAVDHGGPDATVTVGELPDGAGFYVADDGTGLPEDGVDRLFEAGYTTSEEGTGLGLAIVADVADAHGWTVDVTGSEGGGARFAFSGVEFVGDA